MLQRVIRGTLTGLAIIGTAQLAAPAPAQTLTTVRVFGGGATTATQLNRPVYVTAPPGDTSRLFIVEQLGKIRVLDLSNNTILSTFLDLDPLIPDITGNDERGLLGLAFAPDYATTGRFYVNYISNATSPGNTVIARYTATPPSSNVANAGSGVTLLTITQPQSNHNAGCMQFGPDGYLYIATGDGGNGGDTGAGHTTGTGNAQDITSNLLGKILRLDVSGATYTNPSTNPYFGATTGDDEIWALGLRNPWRFSFDRLTGDLYVGDVGQNAWEEIDYVPAGTPAGVNFGWRCYEANAVYNATCGSLSPYRFPAYAYVHVAGQNSFECVIGGYVYRGSAICGLQGAYFFADFTYANIWSFRIAGGAVTEFQDRTAQLAPGGGLSINSPASFGEDGAGELYIVDRGGATSGELYTIVASGATANVSSASPPNATLDPLQDVDAGNNPQGLSQFQVSFSCATTLAPGQITVNCNGGAPCPSVSGVTGGGVGPYTVSLSGPIPPGYCTRFTFANANLGTFNPLLYAFLPGDVNLTSMSTGQDVLTLVSAINGGTIIPALHDMNRNGTVSGQDVLRQVQLLNGQQTLQAWNGVSLICP